MLTTVDTSDLSWRALSAASTVAWLAASMWRRRERELALSYSGVSYVHTLSMYIFAIESEEIVAGAAIERIVVQATPQEKKAISAKAKRLGLPVSELMRRGATAYNSAESDEELGAVADAAMAAANRASDAIDDVLAFVEASNKRIAAMEAKAKKDRKAA